jgi:hypothetical protein
MAKAHGHCFIRAQSRYGARGFYVGADFAAYFALFLTHTLQIGVKILGILLAKRVGRA